MNGGLKSIYSIYLSTRVDTHTIFQMENESLIFFCQPTFPDISIHTYSNVDGLYIKDNHR